jgi:glycosyltransferase involved in cell wall biosynthesis
MKSILFIHQSAELYGSDKTILTFISGLDRSQYFPVVILPFDGPLKTEMEKNGIKVVIAPVLKLYRKMFTPSNLAAFVKEYKKGLQVLDALHKEHDFKLVYSHTLAALAGILFARKRKITHLWHVQEILARPRLINRAFTWLLSRRYNHKAVYDSQETMRFWIQGEPKLAAKSDFVWNGLDVSQKIDHTPSAIAAVRRDFFKAKDGEIVIGLVGRINSWKGQQLLLDAFEMLTHRHKNIRLVYVGSPPPNQDFFLDDLNKKISDYELSDKITIVPFQQDIWKFWDSIDIAVVPSTEPEPFGMVAIEAMMARKPVVAANHGGLTEIVVDSQTGFRFEPNNADALAAALGKLLADPEMRKTFGEKGRARAIEYFSLDNHIAKFEAIFAGLI